MQGQLSVAIHLLELGFDIRTLIALLDHTDVSTTMIYIHFEHCYVGVKRHFGYIATIALLVKIVPI
jgi:hypothetical protein